jgi:hypothetical protein
MIWLRIRKTFGDGSTAIRLASAFLCGLLLGFLGSKIGSGLQNVVPFLLFPPLVGGVAALTIGAHNARPYLMALYTGLVCWAGITLYLFLQPAGAAVCASGSCSSSAVLRAVLMIYLLTGFVLAAPSSLATCAALRYIRRRRAQELPH